MSQTKVALITGSGKRRVGAFVAEALAARSYAVALHYHTSAAEAKQSVARFESQGVAAVAFAADLANEESVRRLVGQTLDRFGRIDVLVNAAAIYEAKRLEDVTAADVRRHLETNTLGTFLCCQHAGLVMAKQPEGGNMVLIGDWAEVRPYLNYAAYFASKGAIPTLTRCLAVELGTRNPRVRVNCILPGPVLFPPDMPAAEQRDAIEATLLRHEGRPENVAQAVLYLIDNDFVTGDCLRVDGGRSIYAGGK